LLTMTDFTLVVELKFPAIPPARSIREQLHARSRV
jgi:hypothetical protein